MFELYATGNAHLTFTPPKVTQTQSALPRELYTPDGRLDLSRVAIGYDLNTAQTQTVLKANPVWRLAISAARDMTLESPTTYDRQDVAATLARYPSICSLDPVNGNFGSLTQTQPTFSLLPPGVTMTTPLEAPRISRVVAMCTSILNFNATTTIQVNAIPEPVFATTQTNPVDVFFHQAARGTPVYASPGDYVVVGPYRQATDSAGNPDTSDTAFHNITTLGRTMRSMVTVTTGGTGQLESYSYPHPVFDLGVPILPTTSATGWQTREDRSFVVTSVNGVDEYPAVLARDLKAVFSSTDFVRGTSSLTNLVIPSSGAQATMTDQVTLAQIRRPITIACAITDTRSETIFGVATGSANNGRPIGLNISEPLVNLTTNLAQRLVSHRALYRNYSTVTSRTTTSDGWLSGLFWQDTWQLAPSAPTTGSIGPFADHPFDGSSTGAPPVPALPEQPLYDMGTVRNHEFLELGLGAASLANNNPLLDATYLRAKNVFLQRLADPTRVWHKDVNPYITLDWMPIDLTIFNGEPNQEGTETAGRLPDPDNPVQSYYDVLNAAPPNANTPMRPLAHLDRRVRFGSRQRGSPSFPFRRTRVAALGNTFTPLANSVNSYFDLWTQPNWLDERWDWDSRPSLTLRVFSADGSVAGKPNLRARYDVKASVKWQHPLQHTLGYLNQGYHAFRSIEKPPGRRAPDPTANVNFEHREIHPFVRPPGNRSTSPSNPSSSLTASPGDLGWYNVWNGSQPDVADVQYLGCPRRPFNWLNWNNRPYASALELMQVPAVGPTRLLFEYDMRRTALASDPGGGNVTTTGSIGPVPYDAHRSANPYLPYLPSAKVNTSSDLVGGYVNAPPFKHLLNFFGSTPAGANPLDMPHVDRKVYAGTVARPESMAGETTNATLPPRFTRLDLWQPNLYRVFEFLTVPTRFSGAVKQHLHGTLAFGGTNARAGLWNTAAEPMTPTIAGAENPLVPTSSPIRVHLSGRFEHPGWPFTAPYNTIPRYR